MVGWSGSSCSPRTRRAEAEARFGELAPGPNGPSPNAASRYLERWAAAITNGDADALASLLTAPDSVTIDRRRVVGSTLDAADRTTNAQWLARRGLEVRCTLLATRGEQLALSRQEYRHPLTLVEMLAVVEVPADGALEQRTVIFDVDDEDAAYAELDERAGGSAGTTGCQHGRGLDADGGHEPSRCRGDSSWVRVERGVRGPPTRTVRCRDRRRVRSRARGRCSSWSTSPCIESPRSSARGAR